MYYILYKMNWELWSKNADHELTNVHIHIDVSQNA